jgi:hypothetical protein
MLEKRSEYMQMVHGELPWKGPGFWGIRKKGRGKGIGVRGNFWAFPVDGIIFTEGITACSISIHPH